MENTFAFTRRLSAQAMVERVVVAALCFFLLLLPLPHVTTLKEISYYLAAGLGIFVLVRRKAAGESVDFLLMPLLVAFGLWNLAGAFFSLDPVNSLHDVRAYWFKYILFYFLIINFFGTGKRIELLAVTILVSGVTVDISLLWSHFVVNAFDSYTKLETGFPEMPVNWLGFISCFALAIGLRYVLYDTRRWVRPVSLGACAVLLLTVFLTQSRATVLASFLVLGYMIWHWRRRFIILFLIAFLVIFAVNPVFTRFEPVKIAGDPRIPIALVAFQVIKEYPFLGIGFGGEIYNYRLNLHEFRKKIPNKYQANWLDTDPHNMLLSVAVRSGIIGLLLFLAVILAFVRNMSRMLRRQPNASLCEWGHSIVAAFVAVLTIGLFEPIGNHVFSSVFFAVLAMGSTVFLMWDKSCFCVAVQL